MNYLAHLSLSFRDPHIMMGNFIADDISLKEVQHLSSSLLRGIMLHRQIDAYTDDHPAFRSSVKYLRINHHKYASVIVDIINDHFLAISWAHFYTDALDDFHDYAYDSLDALGHLVPPSSTRHVENLLKYRYLHAYGSKEGITDVMRRMDERTKFKSNFVGAVEEVYENYDFFLENFISLYSDLRKILDTLMAKADALILQN